MENNKITIFANFCIDSEERYLRMIDSLKSFKNANILSWCLNIRGKYKERAKKYLEEHIFNNLKIFEDEDREIQNFRDQKIVETAQTVSTLHEEISQK